ncbi:stage II sporulation protein M [Paenibacillus cremeus]|uniref:Stage II sporulation protein M n=1 Tax=Paenibacillus cremeus TaxID=2163881 RepID=A0A559JCG7_9BACL|nr:stage II sporulation protein M [Paenibacillus cremeus]TVX97569.1 stage II sporulation protein M [Paenibacillus cremeus]
MNWSNTAAQMKSMKHYFIASALVFIAGIIMGALYSEQFHTFIDSQMEALKQIAQSVDGKENPQWTLFWLIFWNNASKSLLIIALGLFFGVFPLFFLMANGLLIGYMCMVTVEKQSWLVVVKSIIPHGILEIPAIVFASALGLRLGFLVLKFSFSMISPTRQTLVRGQLQGFLKALIPVCTLLVGVLLVAALIESTVTFWLTRS